MDWDDLAWKITGPWGGLRYFRMGMFLVFMGIDEIGLSLRALGLHFRILAYVFLP